jgi:hypothetical protein
VIDDELGHEAVLAFDAPLRKVAGEAKILAVRAARHAVIVRTGTANHWDHEIAHSHSFDSGPDFDDFSEGFMADDELFGSRRRGSILERTDFFIGAAHAGFEHSEFDLERGANVGLRLIDDAELFPDWSYCYRLHRDSPVS